MLTLLLYLIGAVIVGLLIWHRKNKFVLGGLWLLTIALFFNALSQGGGEPLGRQFVKEIGKPSTAEQKIRNYYLGSAKYLIPDQLPAETAKLQPTWFWWKLFGFIFTAATLTSLCRLGDHLMAAARNAGGGSKEITKKIWEQFEKWLEQKHKLRQQRLKLLDSSPSVQPTVNYNVQPPAKDQSDWKTFLPAFCADLASDVLKRKILQKIPWLKKIFG